MPAVPLDALLRIAVAEGAVAEGAVTEGAVAEATGASFDQSMFAGLDGLDDVDLEALADEAS